MRCPHCGFDDPEDFPICTECGQPRVAAGPADPYGAGVGGYPAGPGAYSAVAPHVTPGPRPAFVAAGLPGEGRIASLVGMEGPVDGQEFPLNRAEVGVGRRSDCDIVVSDPSVSRLHAVIRLGATGYVVEDQQSANGTWVNGVRLSGPQPLVERDVIRIGKAAFTFRSSVPSTPQPAGSMTMVSDLGDEPNPFGQAGADFEPPAALLSPEARRPERPPSEPPTPRDIPAGPGRASSSSKTADSVSVARSELAQLRQEIGAFVQRLNSLSGAVSNLDDQLDAAGGAGRPARFPAALRQLSAELAAEGGLDRYRELQRLLEELRADPTDLRLLLRLSDELPAINRLVQLYLRALSLIRDLEPGH